jgi:hypothetical protein
LGELYLSLYFNDYIKFCNKKPLFLFPVWVNYVTGSNVINAVILEGIEAALMEIEILRRLVMDG